MRWQQHIIMVCIILAAAVIQTTLTPLLPAALQPDLLLAIVVISGSFFNPALGAFYAFGIGYLQDLLIAGIPGIYMFTYVAILVAAARLSHEFYAKSAIGQVILISILSIPDILIVVILSKIFGQALVFHGIQILYLPGRIILTALIGIPLFFLMKFLWD